MAGPSQGARHQAIPAPGMPPRLMVPMRRPGTIALVWGVGATILGLVVAFLLVSGEIRAAVLLLLTVLGLLCLSPNRGIYILIAFMPFMYFLRRQVLHFEAFSQLDPILLFPSIVTIAMFLGFIVFYSDRFYWYYRHSAMMKVVVLLLVVFFLEVFNPIQGHILVGVAGAMYYIIPMLWVFLGLLQDRRGIRRILFVVMVIGTITALYGIYQHYFGFSEVERYEMESKRFYKAFGKTPRSMSTFAGLGDFANYMVMSGYLVFAHFMRTKKNLAYLVILATMVVALIWTASRTCLLMLLLSVLLFFILKTKRKGIILLRGLAALALVVGIYAYLYSKSSREIYRAQGTDNPFIAHTVAGMTHPTEESTFLIRLDVWGYVLRSAFTEFPFGRGLGTTTTAANKFGGGKMFEGESYFFGVMYGSGPFAALLFVVLVTMLMRSSLNLTLAEDESSPHRLILAFMTSVIVGSVFGGMIGDQITGPVIWLLIGWTVKESVDRAVGPAPGSETRAA